MTVKPLASMPLASALTGAEILYAQQAGADVKVTASQFSQHFLAKSYGVMADGVTDDTAAAQAALNAVTANGGALEFPNGIILISATLTLLPSVSTTVHIFGQSFLFTSTTGGTEFRWIGAAGIPMFRLQHIQRSVFEHFGVRCFASNPLAVGIQSEAGSDGNTGTNKYRNIGMNGTTSALGKGFAFVEGAGGIDSGNDTCTFSDIIINNCATAAWSFEHGESKAHSFFNCHFVGAGLYGVSTALGAGNQGGSFCWYGGSSSGATEADFYLGGADDTIVISGGNFESSNRFVEQVAASWASAAWPVLLLGNRWSGDALNADGFAIKFYSAGPLVLIGNIIGQFTGHALKIWLQGDDPPPAAEYGISIGNYYTSTDPTVLQVASGQWGSWSSFQDIRNNGGVLAPLVQAQNINQQVYSVNSSTSSSTLLTGANISGGSIEHTLDLTGAITSASNAQLPTVANLLTAIGGLTHINNQTYKLRVINSGGSGSGVWTVTTNTGWTLNGTMSIAVGAWREFIVTITDPVSAISASLQSIGAGTK